MEPVRPFYLPSFEKEAEAIVARARDLARDLTVSAAAEAVRLREEASREGLERGRAEGREIARREEAQVLQSGIKKILAEVERHRGHLEKEAERDLVRLAIAIAGKIVKAEVKRGTPVAMNNLRAALHRAVRGHGLEIRLHPDDAARFRPAGEDQAGATIIADASITPGGCIVRTAAGTVDLDIKTQLEEIERGLLGG
ncbi:MAG TPA: FliH/SctL family protein [Candidatus Eisenbacteria bacterium]|nr:FliH/SctL family protein [Candidatus Eisenbacteria bacterium]